MKHIMVFVAALLLMQLTQAQFEMVVYDYEKSFFNEGRPLPSESFLMISGEIEAKIDFVEIGIYKNGNGNSDNAFFSNHWKRGPGNSSNHFVIPINVKLKADDVYDVKIRYFQAIDDGETQLLKENIVQTLGIYIDQTADKGSRSLRLKKPASFIVSEMNGIVNRWIELYKTQDNRDFPGFSDMVKLKLKQLNNVKVRRSDYRSEQDSTVGKVAAQQSILDGHITGLKQLIGNEMAAFLDRKIYKETDQRLVKSYATEGRRRVLTLQAGYGGVWVTGSQTNPSLGLAPFAGISVPLAHPASRSKVLRNMSINTGVYITNFNGPNGETYSGPLLQRPFYVGLGYKLFYIFRANAGLAVLEEQVSGNSNLVNLDKISLRPYIGLSAEINIWVGLNK